MKKYSLILYCVLILSYITACTPTPKQEMEHGTAMTAHAGKDKSIDVHLYTIYFNQPTAKTGQEASLEFVITEKDSGKPVTKLEIMHDKPIHLVLVRKDLKHFDHIHPILKGNNWVVPYVFNAAGEYRLWVDFTKNGIQHIVDFDLSVSGKQEVEEQDRLYGLKVDMQAPSKITTDNNVMLDFVVTDANGKAVPITEKFLAANAHLITIDESLQKFNHNHDMNFDNDNVLSFTHMFSKAGRHKAWVQFSVNGQVRTASFDFSVSEGMSSMKSTEKMGHG